MAKKRTVKTELLWVTPEMATQWLKKNVNNRNMNQYRVARYARDMRNGDWEVTGDGIRFSKTGKLLDGQHRLWACLQAESKFQTLVVTGLEDNAQIVMDQGMPRTKGSQLKLLGYKRSGTLASAATVYAKMETGRSYVLARGQTPSISEVLDIVEQNPDILKAMEKYFSHKATRGIKMHSGVMIAMYVYMSRFSESKADEFIESFLTGANLYKGHPALALRDRVMQARMKNQKALHDEFMTWVAYAWRSFVVDKKLHKLSPRYKLPLFPGAPAGWKDSKGIPYS